MKRTPLVVGPLALMVVVGLVWASTVIGTKAPTSSVDTFDAVALDYSPEPIPCDVESSGCFYDCDLSNEQPGSGGKCWVRFSVFHTEYGEGCCGHHAPDEVVFCYRYHGDPFWCHDTAERGPLVEHPDLECDGYYYFSSWLELDDDTSYDFSFECESGCYCEGTVYVDC